MKLTRRRTRQSKGSIFIEFAFTVLMTVPLILGVLAIGIRYIREITINQVSRDLANMYVRGVNFKSENGKLLLQRLATGYDFSASGKGVAILSRIRGVYPADCVGISPCNVGQAVFAEQITMGNGSIRISKFGKSSPMLPDKDEDALDQLRNSNRVAQNFLSVLPLQGSRTYEGPSGATVVLQPQQAYVVEVTVNTDDLAIPGFMPQNQIHSRTIF